MSPSSTASRPLLVRALAGVALLLVLATGCSSGSGPGSSVTVPDRSTTTTTIVAATTTTDRKPETTTTARATTTTTSGQTTTTTGGASTTSTAPASTTTAPATTTTTAKSTTTTEDRTTTTPKETTSTEKASTTSSSTIDPALVDEKQKDIPWLAFGALLAVLVLVLIVAARSRSQRAAWWTRADALVHDGRSLVDLGTAGPAGADPQQQIAHWGTIEQRAQAFANQIQALSADGVPDDVVRDALGGLGQATADYLAALRTLRTLRIGPPAPTADQLQYADAESGQRLAIVRATLDQLDQLILPHRQTS